MLFLPGGFSGGDEPDGSAKFITSFLRNPSLSAGVQGGQERINRMAQELSPLTSTIWSPESWGCMPDTGPIGSSSF